MALNFPNNPGIGSVYTDNTSGFSYEWDGTVWKSYSSATANNIQILDDISGSFNGSTQTFALTSGSLAVTPASTQSLIINLGGVIQNPNNDYYTSGSNITFSTAPAAGLTFFGTLLGSAVPIGISTIGDVYNRQVYSVTGVQTSFSFASGYDVGYLDVFRNGSRLISGDDFTATNGTSFSLSTAAQNGDSVEAIGYKISSVAVTEGSLVNLTVNQNATILGTTNIGTNVGSGTTALTVLGDTRITGIVTASSFSGNLTGTATGLSGTPNITVGVVTATTELDVGTGGTIFTSLSSGRTGVGTINPRFTLEVGAVGAAGTQLWVNGDARVTGVLSIGQGTVTINGNTNQINIGTGVTIHETNGIQVGGNTFNSAGLTLNSLNVTGVLTATGGVNLGIQSGGINVNSGVVTALNFVGSGNTFAYNAGTKTVNISIAGGGAAATRPTQFSTLFFTNESGYNSGAPSYAAMARTAGGTKGNTFFIVRAEGASSPTTTRYRVYPITVNRTTGVITQGSAVDAWTNSSVANNYSTVYFMGPDGTGAIFAGGNNAIPGTSSYTFSYFKFIVNSNGTLSDTAQVNSGADHITNGTYMTLPTAINSGYIPSIGYQASNNRAHYRLSTTNGSTISVGNIVDLGSDTSTVYAAQMYSQPGVYQSGNQVIGFMNYRVNSSTYYIKAFSANGLNADYAFPTFDSQLYGFQMANGDVILYCLSIGRVLRFTAYNSVIDISSTALTNFIPTSVSGNYIYPHFCIGTNEFVFSLSTTAPFAFNTPLVKATLNSSTGFTVTGVSSPDSITSVGYSNEYTSLFPLYANANDATPDKLLLFVSNSNYTKAKVISMPTFTAV